MAQQRTKQPVKRKAPARKRRVFLSTAKRRKLLLRLSKLSTLSRANARRAILLASVSGLGAIGGVISLKKQRTALAFPSVDRLFSRRTSGIAALSDLLRRR